jgi:branched-subunit amino acid transport protein AzlD
MYENYNNSYDIVRGIKAPILQFANIFDVNLNLGLFALIFIICCWLFRSIKLQKIALNVSLLGMAAGVIIFILGAFPYWILGRVPTFNEFSSRHQLLIPLGTAVFWSYCLAGFNSNSRRVGLSVLVSLSLAIGMVSYLDLYIDWKKQKQIISFLKKDPISKNSDLVLFEDNSMSMNFNKRELKPYEWNGLLSLAFSDQKRFGLYQNELHLHERGFYDYYMSSHFKADQFHRGRCSLIAIVSIAPGRIDTRDLGFKQSEFFKDQLLGVFQPEFKISSRYKENSGTCNEE